MTTKAELQDQAAGLAIEGYEDMTVAQLTEAIEFAESETFSDAALRQSGAGPAPGGSSWADFVNRDRSEE